MLRKWVGAVQGHPGAEGLGISGRRAAGGHRAERPATHLASRLHARHSGQLVCPEDTSRACTLADACSGCGQPCMHISLNRVWSKLFCFSSSLLRHVGVQTRREVLYTGRRPAHTIQLCIGKQASNRMPYASKTNVGCRSVLWRRIPIPWTPTTTTERSPELPDHDADGPALKSIHCRALCHAQWAHIAVAPLVTAARTAWSV